MYYIEPITMKQAQALVEKCGLEAPAGVDVTLGLFHDNDGLIATGSLKRDMIQGVAVNPAFQGEDILGKLLTALIDQGRKAGVSSLYLFTKPERAVQFQGLGFRQIGSVWPYAALLEWGEEGVGQYVEKLKHIRQAAEQRRRETTGFEKLTAAAIVMHANPFTRGHRYLIEQAGEAADLLYVLVVEEEGSMFSYEDRIEMVRRGTADLSNVTVLGGGRYAVSALTFPSYFTGKDRASAAHTAMDAELFAKYIAPALGISLRFVGCEPFSPVTDLYNRTLTERLPKAGIAVRELERLAVSGTVVSASAVRALLADKEFDKGAETALMEMLPSSTVEYLKERGLWGR
ncbi:MAG: [citrate (pro-3S)-lyase] ligase [Firmicutes bacterium]|nr:[citrate (pro-3S)-lyase] ligase [Bacillota bacterium]